MAHLHRNKQSQDVSTLKRKCKALCRGFFSVHSWCNIDIPQVQKIIEVSHMRNEGGHSERRN